MSVMQRISDKKLRLLQGADRLARRANWHVDDEKPGGVSRAFSDRLGTSTGPVQDGLRRQPAVFAAGEAWGVLTPNFRLSIESSVNIAFCFSSTVGNRSNSPGRGSWSGFVFF